MRGETILIVDDEKLIRWSLNQTLTKEGYTVLEAATVYEALEAISQRQPDLIILDQLLPDGTGIEMLQKLRAANNDAMVIMLTAIDRSNVAVQAMKLGAYDYVTKPVDHEELKIVIQKVLETSQVKRQLKRLQQEQEKQHGFCEIVGSSPSLKKVLEFISKVAESNATTILITGDSGTGKELVARAIHNMSARCDKPLMTVNCSALPENLVESELFGHEKGAFTDAKSQKKGVFELADKGTIFLDEIGEVKPTMQVKLLRVLDQKTFKRVGGTADISVDVRIIAATNRPLELLIKDGRFREDLYYRLNVASVRLPPLRERGEDVLLLSEYFLQQFNTQFHKQFRGLSLEVQEVFRRYSWPGNVRELKNVLERAILLNTGDELLLHHVEVGSFQKASNDHPVPMIERSPDGRSLDELEKEAITQALQQANQNQSLAARLLKISRDTLRYRMKKHGLFHIASEHNTTNAQ
jgi:two-component system, NtrC family, response regulator AtoC